MHFQISSDFLVGRVLSKRHFFDFDYSKEIAGTLPVNNPTFGSHHTASLEGPAARCDPARESGARAPVAGAMSHSPPGGPAVASPSGAAAARSPSSESPDAYGDACPVLTCQALDSLVAKCQARAAVTAQRTCSFPANQHKQVRLPPPVVAGLEELAEMLGAGRTEARNRDRGGRSPTIGDQVHPHFSCSAHRGRSISGASRQAHARALCVHMSCCTWCTNLRLALRHSD